MFSKNSERNKLKQSELKDDIQSALDDVRDTQVLGVYVTTTTTQFIFTEVIRRVTESTFPRECVPVPFSERLSRQKTNFSIGEHNTGR